MSEDSAGHEPLVLDVANPPADLGYEDYEDFRYREICRLNKLSENTDSLTAALRDPQYTLQAAAAHTLGQLGLVGAVPALVAAADHAEDVVEPEIGYALVRLGARAEGSEILNRSLTRRVGAYVSPLIAAGYLAQLGDPSGAAQITAGLDDDNDLVRMIAAKQFYFFIPFDEDGDDDDRPNVWSWYERALRDENTDVHWQAVVELGMTRAARARGLLAQYAEDGPDADVRAKAAALLGRSTE